MNAIEISGLTKRYRDTLTVDSLTLSIGEGEIFSLLGVNGAGKTTTVKMLATLTEATEGDALLLGKSIRREPFEVKSFIGVSPQESAVAPGLSVRENLELIAGVHGISNKVAAQKIAELSELLGLDSVINKRAGKLSGGWQRRLSIAMALIGEPKILFLDEPTLGLDVIIRSELWDIIRALRGRATVVLTTHYMEEAEALSDRIAIMNEGRLLVCDTPENIKSSVGAENIEEAFVRIVRGVKK